MSNDIARSVVERGTLVEMLREHAQRAPSRVAYTWSDGEGAETAISFGELDDRVRSLAAALQRGGAAGERVLLLFPHGLDYIVSFMACLYANGIPIPAYPPDVERLHRSLPRLASLVVDASPKVVLATRDVAAKAEAIASFLPTMASVRWLTADSALAPGDFRDGGRRRDDLAFLQYTSGSTSDAKGVMVTHGNIVANHAALSRCYALDHETVVVSWLPMFHDMGLIFGVLHALYDGHAAHLMSPLTFLQRPIRWLRAISKHRATFSGGPNFAYDLCIHGTTEEERASLDLRTWRRAFSGAEAVRATTVERFAALFAPHGFEARSFSPAYGLAEATLMVSGHRAPAPPSAWIVDADAEALAKGTCAPDRGGRPPNRVVSTGRPIEDHRVIVVDPETRRPRDVNQVGEIWVSGPSVARGYWGRPETTKEVFDATTDAGDGPFMRTGDLGLLRGGELYITGRLKDVIIVRGLNHAPPDVERTSEESSPSLRLGCVAAFSVEVPAADGGASEEMVVVQDVKDGFDAAEGPGVASAIRERIVAAHGVDPYAVVLTRRGSVPKTSSGKIRRRACRDAYLRGELATAFAWQRPEAAQVPVEHGATDAAGATDRAAEAEIRAWLFAYVSRRARVAAGAIDPRRPFAMYGLGSADAVALSGELARHLGRPVPPTIAYEHATIDALARHLAAGKERAADDRSARHAPSDEPIAVIGVSCRLPGAPDPDAYWKMLEEGRHAIGLALDDRLALLGAPERAPEGTPKHAALLPEVRDFDASFFGIAPREAALMDPQQRILLELSWEALEHAAIAASELEGGRTGVFVGLSGSDFARFAMGSGDLDRADAYAGSGAATSVAAGRIAYTLGLRGPALAVDTACSSSLVAVHLAVQSLRSGESDLALAGGAQLLLRVEPTLALNRMGALSPTGRCHTFDASADGYVRGEGGGVVVLKRLRDAERDGDRVLAVVRGSAINHDGRSNGLTVPSGEAQRRVLEDALADANVRPRDVAYVEAHGTGTPLGDPVELRALGHVYGAERSADAPLLVGSVKTNVGHLEAAAGIAALVKVVLSFEHGAIPPHLGLETPTPNVAWSELPIRVPSSTTAWPPRSRRLAGVSAFGFSGTNAHVVLEAPATRAGAPHAATDLAPGTSPAAPRAGAGGAGPARILTLSAHTEAALRASAARLAGVIERGAPVDDVCFTANVGRSHLAHRAAIVAEGAGDLASKLRALGGGAGAPGVARGEVTPSRAPSIAFLFSGQGSQYAGMGSGLLDAEPVFRDAIERCARVLDPLLGASLVRLLCDRGPGAASLDETHLTQPALFAVEYALAEQWRAWGIAPSLVIGHSVGELVAATVAGVLPLDDALALVAARGRLMQERTRRGAMISVFASEDEVRDLLDREGRGDGERAPRDHRREGATTWGGVSLAAVNGPEAVVLSGDEESVVRVSALLEAADMPVKRLAVSRAFHSALMDPMLDELERLASPVRFGAARVALVSNVTGAIAGDEVRTAGYWREHARRPVRFADGARLLEAHGVDVALEIGPHPVLLSLAKRALAASREANGRASERAIAWLPSLRKGANDVEPMAQSLAALYAAGAPIDWRAVHAGAKARKVALPTYPFQRERHWPEPPRAARAPSARGDVRRLRSPLLAGEVFERDVASDHPAFAEHRIYGTVIVPAAGHVAMCASAVLEASAERGVTLDELTFTEALAIADGATKTVQVCLGGPEDPHAYRLVSADDRGGFTVHSAGRARAGAALGVHEGRGTIAARLREAGGAELSADEFFASAARRGVDLGPGYRWIERIVRTEREAIVELRAPRPTDDAAGLVLHAGLLDTFIQSLGASLAAPTEKATAYVPLSIERVALAVPLEGPSLSVHVRVRPAIGDGTEGVVGDLTLFEEGGRVVGELTGLFMKRAEQSVFLRAPSPSPSLLHETAWVEAPRASARGGSTAGAPGDADADPDAKTLGGAEVDPGAKETWIVLGDSAGLGDALADVLEESGRACVRVGRGEDFAAIDEAGVILDPERRDHYDLLLDALGGRPCAGVVHLFALDASADDDLEAAHLEREHRLACASATYLVQALAERGLSPRVCFVTRRAQAVAAGDDVDVAQAPLWALGRVVALEHPELRPALVDLGGGDPIDEADAVVAELRDGAPRLAVAIRGAKRLVPRIVARAATREPGGAAATSAAAPSIAADGTYLVTGGTGALGLQVARRLVDRGARTIVLAARRSPDRAALDAIADLERAGARVVVERADVEDPGAVARLIALAGSELPSLRGIVHAAGALDDAPLSAVTWERAAAVLGPKALGAWNLHRATLEAQLDFFVLFSSASSLVGAPGQAAYGAANGFLDALAQHRRAAGLPATSVQWGPWAGAGFAAQAGEGAKRAWAARGVEGLEPAAALDALDGIIAERPTKVAVLSVSWPKYVEASPEDAGDPLFASVLAGRDRPRAAAAAISEQEAARLRAIAASIARASGSERVALLEGALRAEAAAVLGLASKDLVASNRPLGELGLDSMMGIDLMKRVGAIVGRKLPVTVLFNHPSPSALARHLAADAGASTPSGARVATPSAPDVARAATPAAPRRDRAPEDGARVAPRAAAPRERWGAMDPIAIVGMSCSYPGAPDLDAFWRLLAEGRHAIVDVPKDRWDVDAYFDPDLAPGTINTKRGGFIDGVDLFDPGFFDLSLAEARGMDPQQRLLLEHTFRALEHAGIAPEGLRGSAAGVFVGISTFDYVKMQREAPSRAGTGVVHSIAANRISYLFDLRGPSMAIDTACSSSLVAAHLAMRSLKSGECDLAIVGGVNTILSPDATVGFAQAGMLSSDGFCKSFDAAADGYVRGEGCGVIVLKRRADAERARDRVVAVLRGSATNQDGRSNGLTAPNGAAQVAVIRSALEDAGVAPGEVSCVETHGTGTPVGDAIEAQALAEVFRDRDPSDPCVVSCAKPNIGHLEAGAGVAAIIKVALSLQHEAVPPLSHLVEKNPAIPDDAKLLFPTALHPLPRRASPRLAGISGFGFGGANVHVIVEEGPREAPRAATARDDGPWDAWNVVTVSGRTERAVPALAAAYAAALDGSKGIALGDAALTWNAGRSHLPHRAAIVANGAADARAQLASLAAHAAGSGAARGVVPRGAEVRVALVARGAHGRSEQRSPRLVASVEALAETHPAIRGALLDARRACDMHAKTDDAARSLARFAAEYALGAAWASWIAPEAIAGGGTGAWVAACLAGAISLESAAALVASRGAADVPVAAPASRLVVGASSFEPGEGAADVLRACRVEAASSGDHNASSALRSSCDAAIDVGFDDGAKGADAFVLAPRLGADGDPRRAILEAIAALYVRGAPIDWAAVDGGLGRRGRALPGHPFERRRCWLDPSELAPLRPPTRASDTRNTTHTKEPA